MQIGAGFIVSSWGHQDQEASMQSYPLKQVYSEVNHKVLLFGLCLELTPQINLDLLGMIICHIPRDISHCNANRRRIDTIA